MAKAPNHRISVCTSCRNNGSDCRPGREFIKRLREAIDLADDIVGDDFDISGVACMAGCDRPCTVAYHGSKKATYLFGDIDPRENIEDLIAFAKQYATLEDGWCSSTQRPDGLSNKTLARVPASLLVTSADERPLH